MIYEVRLHPSVIKFLNSLQKAESERCREALKSLESDPFNTRSGADIKKLKGTKHSLYRLCVGGYRFEYFVEASVVWVVKAFAREAGY